MKDRKISHRSGHALILGLLPNQNTEASPSSHHDKCAASFKPSERRASYPGEERVEAVDLLPLGDIGVVLRYALQRQLLHQVYLVGFLEVLGLQHRRRVKTLTRNFLDKSFLLLLELLTMNFCTLMGKVAE